jgi:predicted O-methyltransferase YrrM
MNQEIWTAVDRYLAETLIAPDAALAATLEACEAAGLPAIGVTPQQGSLLYLLALTARAENILEIGTLGGYSAIWLARALPAAGRLVTLEAEPEYAALARSNVRRAGLADKVEVRTGAALATLPALAAEARAPFDLVFIDADKANAPAYFDWSLELTRAGSLIVVDNVVRGGAVADAASADPSVLGIRRLNEKIAAEPRVAAAVVQTVGAKGYDGMALLLVTKEPGK